MTLLIDCLCVIRDEAELIGPFLEHYRRLGVDRFVVIENRSVDGTREILEAQDDVLVIDEPGSYRDSRAGQEWLNRAGAQHCTGRWTLIADADEFLVLPQPDDDLPSFVARLENEGAKGALAAMVTMMAGQTEPNESVAKEPLDRLFEQSPWYLPREAHRWSEREAFPHFELRSDAWAKLGRPRYNPALLKLALVRWEPGFYLRQANHVTSPVPLSRELTLFAHFKFRAGLRQRGLRERERSVRMNREVVRTMMHLEDALAETDLHAAGLARLDARQLRGTDWCDATHGTVLPPPFATKALGGSFEEPPNLAEETVRELLDRPALRRTRKARETLYRFDLLHHMHLPEQMLRAGDLDGAETSGRSLLAGWPAVLRTSAQHVRKRIKAALRARHSGR